MDEDNLPPTIDLETPVAFAHIRQAQIRWTQKLASTVTWSAALEENKSSIVVPTTIPGKAEYPWPDLVTRFRFEVPKGHVSTSAFLGTASFRPTGGDPDNVRLWGSMLSVKFSTTPKDSIYSIVTYGEGIGRYRGGTTAVPDDNGRLHAVGGLGVTSGYEHFWQDRWSSNVSFSHADTNDEPFYTSGLNNALTYVSANLLYWFLGEHAWAGAEYLYGKRQVFGGGSDTGTAHRVQFAVRFNLP